MTCIDGSTRTPLIVGLGGTFRPGAVGVIACAGGAQGSITTLAALRDIAHALRGWPTPFGAGVVAGSADEVFDDPARVAGLDLVGVQVAEFAATGLGRTPAAV